MTSSPRSDSLTKREEQGVEVKELFDAVVQAVVEKLPAAGATVDVLLNHQSREGLDVYGASARADMGIRQYNFGLVHRESPEAALRALEENVRATPAIAP